ncbi:hypothetical protein Pst134EA_033328 [Puccinia striiformis f. sp. tritici]|uniref:hypothetical protein n=1 Tax=Puccinia striiformis f. sp. tritici TaxID=168172 RepID=UPI002007B69C|nr:hypothetical protein Pst134EA_033328 [Puccinia striiformis f. sp. tritici]KAH9469870.1 hypothetical protein Pst134EA_033328 [Puccinia striiformis f. sp. tritici]
MASISASAEDRIDTIPPPPEESYDSREDCMKSIQAWALERGFAIVVKSSYNGKGKEGNGDHLHRTHFVCDKSGHYWPHRPPTHPATSGSTEVPAEAKEEASLPAAPQETASASTKTEKDAKGTGATSTKIKKNANVSRKTGCPFHLVLNHNPDTFKWDLTVSNPDHNHKPSDNPSAHIVHRRLTETQKKEIIKLDAAGVPPLKIKNSLLKEGTLHAPLKTIHNLNHKERKKNDGGGSAVESMVQGLKSCGFTYQIQSEISDKTGAHHLNAVFMAFPESLKLAKQHSTCILIDATYKTNRYKMPLMHIAGVNSSNSTFTIGFYFLATEKEGDFEWALQQLKTVLPCLPAVILTDKEQALMSAIKSVFPSARHLLCQWHIRNNLWTHCQPLLVKGGYDYDMFLEAWNFLLASKSQEEYEANCVKMAATCTPEVMKYMNKNWLPLKGMFVNYLISDLPHFGNKNTSRVESLHASVKRFLHGANSSIYKTIVNMRDALNHQLHELMINSATQKTVHINALPAVLSQLSGTISHFALRACQCAYSAGRSTDCKDCTYELHWGMPCSHRMRQLDLQKQFLKPEDFHMQWHFPDVSNIVIPEGSNEENSLSHEALDQAFLTRIYERFQKLPVKEKGSFIDNFERLLDQTDVLAPLAEPLEQQHKGRPNNEKKKKKKGESAKSTKREPSAWEHKVQAEKKNKRGRPRKVVSVEENPPVEEEKVEPEEKRGRGRPSKNAGLDTKAVGCKRKKAKKSPSEWSDSDVELPDITLEQSTAETSGCPAKRARRVPQVPSATEVAAPPPEMKTRSGRVIKRIINMNEEEEEESSSDTQDGGTDGQEYEAEDNPGDDGEEDEEEDIPGDDGEEDEEEEISGYEDVSKWRDFDQAHSMYASVSSRVRKMISSIRDVDSDGHCGFRSAAASIGQKEIYYEDIRLAMVREIDLQAVYQQPDYLSMMAEDIPFALLRNNLNFTQSPCQKKHWIVFPRHGEILADALRRPIIHISNLIMATYLPLSYGPTNLPPVFLVYLEGKYHYNAFKFKGRGGIYPALPISRSWFKWRKEVATDWEALIQINRDEWDTQVPKGEPGALLDVDAEDGLQL